ncbi:MAG: FecR family protein [Polyangiales bacterium]
MRPAAKRRPIDHVTPRLGNERVERMWSVVEQAQQPSRRRWMYVAAAAAIALGVWRTWPSPALTSGDVVSAATAVSLPDGSELRTAEATELRVVHAEPEEVELALTQGRLQLDVSHRTRRRFAVRVGDLTVLVRGTAFTVEAKAQDVRVQVARGLVEVRMRQVVLASLSAGQSWSGPAVAPPVEAEESFEEPVQAVATPEPTPSTPGHERRPARRVREKPAPETAAMLLERANDARLAGDARAAADLYQELRTRFPRDPRAGLSAFELARISLHALHDPQRALAALQFALAHGHGFAREDAEALEVEALALAKQDCGAARDRFLGAYPNSAQRTRVARACP